jgi:hypothetical protein
MVRRMRARWGAVVGATGLVLGLGCGYNTTGRSAANVGDLYIPFFEDETNSERAVNLGTRMTELVVAEFRQDRAIRVYQAASERAQASKELIGAVKRVSESVLTRSPEEQREEYRVVVVCSITYKDLVTDKVLWQDGAVTGDGNYLIEEGDAGFEAALAVALDEVLDQILDKTIKAW